MNGQTEIFFGEFELQDELAGGAFDGTLITTLTNAGEVSTEGFELDFLAKPLDNFTLSGGIAYTDAQVDKYFTPPGQTRDGTCVWPPHHAE